MTSEKEQIVLRELQQKTRGEKKGVFSGKMAPFVYGAVLSARPTDAELHRPQD